MLKTVKENIQKYFSLQIFIDGWFKAKTQKGINIPIFGISFTPHSYIAN